VLTHADTMTDILDGRDSLDGLHGAYTYRYAREELGEYRLRTAVETGELLGFGRGVLLDARRVFDLRTRSAGALLLTAGAGVLVGPTAAALHGCTAIGGFPIHVRVPYVRRIRSRGGLVVHQGETAQEDVTVLDGLRVLAVDLTLTEVLCSAPNRTALACADQLLARLRPDDRPTFVRQVSERLSTRPDRRGTKRATALLALATGRPRSPAESAFVLVITEAGLPNPICQYEPPDHPRTRLTFAWPEAQVALQYEETPPNPPTEQPPSPRGWTVVKADTQDLTDPTALSSRLRSAFRHHQLAA
jgi:hypothetical protein